MIKRITAPLKKEEIISLNAGDEILLTGYIYTARDAAHKKMIELIEQNKELPFNIENQIIYYVGPTPNKPDEIIGAAGPTTSYRMDDMTLPLLKLGLKGMIGKGKRSEAIKTYLKEFQGIYFIAIGGIGALMSSTVKENVSIAFEELGAEAIRKLYVEDMPLYVGIDSFGNDIYEDEVR
ncbi:MAG: Fe-S-containing hydro-lyase [Clostridiales bacterium]|nr:Fe-S-containing hydro-lyase [Clostridiales bacterium]